MKISDALISLRDDIITWVTNNLKTYLKKDATAVAASKLTTNAGSNEQPVYFKDGVPIACGYKVKVLTQAEYDALTNKDTNTIYLTT